MKLVHKSYGFLSQDLNSVKYEELFLKAVQIRDYKNYISEMVCEDFSRFVILSKYEWVNYFRTKLPNCNNQDIYNSISDVFVAYDNKKDQLLTKSTITIQKEFKISLYKKNVGNKAKGDIKSYELTKKSTSLTKVVSFLTRYWNDGLIDYITNNIDDNESKQKFRNQILTYLDKYGDRLINLVESRQQRLINSVVKNKIEFESYSFTSTTEQKQNIITKNPNKNSKYNAYITLSGQKTDNGKITIPVKFSNKYHGKIKHYYKEFNSKNQRIISYTIVFDEKNKQVRINLVRLKHDDVVINKTNYYGLDINIKHNLFMDKHGNGINFDEDILKKYVKLLKKLDNKLKQKRLNNEKPILNKKDRLTMDRSTSIIKDMVKRKSNLAVKQAIELGRDHIVLEDLNLNGKLLATSEIFEGFKYSRLTRILSLSDIKNIITSIANKHGLQVSVIQPQYTSQTCRCGCIDKRNRPTQEIFKCISCGYTENADTHSAGLIEDRLSQDVLRDKLLICQNGIYKPKKLNKSTIKNIVSECYDIINEKSLL
jgi:IS605 OrfB family transposase